MPKLLAAFERGIPHKVEADKQGALVYFGYTEVGELGGWMGVRGWMEGCGGVGG